MKLLRKAGVTSEIWQVFIQDTSKFDGSGVTGLTNATVTSAYYHRDTDTTATVIALVSMTVGTFTSKGFKEIDATNMPGWYQFCPPDAALASGAKSCGFLLKGATNMAPLAIEAQLVAVDVDDSVRLGLTAIPNATAGANGGLPLGDASGRVDLGKWLGTAASTPTVAGVPNVNAKTWNDLATVALPLVPATAGRTLVVDAAGLADANVVKLGPTGAGTAQTAKDIGGVFTGITLLAQWLGAMAGKQTANSTARTEIRATGAGSGTFDETTDANEAIRDRGDAAYLTATSVTVSDKTGFSLSAAAVQAIWDALTSALTTVGSIGKLLVDKVDATISSRSTYAGGAVASVTGNVGGNVTGSVGSIATGGIVAASFAAGAIDAAAIATDAIGSAELAASAITEIQTGLSTLDAAGVRTAVGLASANLDTQIAAVQSDTDDIQSRLPAALTGAGNLKADAQVVSDKTGYALTAAYDAAKTAAQAGDAMTLTAAYTAAKTASQAGDAMTLTSGERTSVGTAVWASATRTLTSFGTLVSDIWAAVADSTGVTTLLARLTATRAGYLDNLSAGVPTSGAIADQVWEETLADHSGTAGSTAAALNAAGAAGDPWATAVPGAYGAGTAGNILGTNLDVAVSSRTKPADTQAAVTLVATTTTLTNDPAGVTTLLSRLSALRAGYLDNLSAGAVALQSSLQGLVTTVGAAGAGLTATASAVWAVATRVLTAGTNIALAKGVGVTGFNDLDAAGVRSAVGLASANLDTKFVTIATLIGALNDLSSADVQTAVDTLLAAAITSDDMPAVGDRPSVYQAAYLGFQFFVERNVTGTTMTVSKADGSGALVTVTLDDAAAPTALTRAS